jgi:hypothetical protein
VLVEPNEPVKKGQPLFRFDRRPYEYAVQETEAALAAAKQNVLVLKADLDAAVPGVARAHAELQLAKEQYDRFTVLAPSGAVSTEDIERHADQLASAEAGVDRAEAEEHRARLAYAGAHAIFVAPNCETARRSPVSVYAPKYRLHDARPEILPSSPNCSVTRDPSIMPPPSRSSTTHSPPRSSAAGSPPHPRRVRSPNSTTTALGYGMPVMVSEQMLSATLAVRLRPAAVVA